MFTSSVVSYPERGPFGNPKYRGNTTGKIIIDLIENFLPPGGLFVDPAIGGGTTQDVVNYKQIKRFAGFDLHSGFNLLKDDLKTRVGAESDLIFFHPPYSDMVLYSNNMWGDKAHKDDLSQMTETDFEQALKLCLYNISDATKAGGHYAVLIGNQRKNGRYLNWSSMTEQLAPDLLVDEIIKVQHNCVSDSRKYSKPIVRINHEKLLVFRKSPQVNAITSLEKSLMTMNSRFMNDLLVTLKRMFQCSSWTQEEVFDYLKHLYQEGPFDFRDQIIHLLNSEHFVNQNGSYSLA